MSLPVIKSFDIDYLLGLADDALGGQELKYDLAPGMGDQLTKERLELIIDYLVKHKARVVRPNSKYLKFTIG